MERSTVGPGWPAATTSVAAVVGDPIAHSLSPIIHNAAFRSCGLDWAMIALRVRAEAGDHIIAAMRTLELAALAVTTPHKATVARSVDRLDTSARALRSVNTVQRDSDGALVGWSTDGLGFVDSLRSNGFDPSGERVVIIGAGGAARSIIAALGEHGCSNITVVNRSQPVGLHATAVAHHVGFDALVDVVPASRLIVNATPLGMAATDGADRSPVPAGLLGPGHLVVDIVFHAIDTPLLVQARREGATTIDGLGMLIHQAVLQQEIWTGHRPDPELMRSAALAALAERPR